MKLESSTSDSVKSLLSFLSVVSTEVSGVFDKSNPQNILGETLLVSTQTSLCSKNSEILLNVCVESENKHHRRRARDTEKINGGESCIDVAL